MSLPIVQPVTQYFNRAGILLEAGYIYIGEADADPQTNPIDVFWDADGSIPATQPIRTIAGYPARSGAPAPLYVDVTEYSVRWTESNGNLVAYLPSVPVPISTGSVFGLSLINAEDVDEAQTILELVPGTDVQAYDPNIATVVASEAAMRAAVIPDLRSMSPELVGFAIDELGTSVRVTDDDTTAGRLEDKIIAGTGIDIDVVSPGANEKLRISVDASVTSESIVATGSTQLLFDDIPSGVNFVDVAYCVLGDMTNDCLLQFGTSGGIKITDYRSMRADMWGNDLYGRAWNDTGIILGGNSWTGSPVTADAHSGVLSFRHVGDNFWTMSGSTGVGAGGNLSSFAGQIDLGGTLTQIKISTGVAFTAGVVTIFYW